MSGGDGGNGAGGCCERTVRVAALAVILAATLLMATATFPGARTVGAAWAPAAGGIVAAPPAEEAAGRASPAGGAACASPRNVSAPLFAFFLPLSHVPVPVDATGLRFVGEVARAAVAELALSAKLGRAVTAADVRLFVVSRDEALRLVADGARTVPDAERGAPLGALDAFDVAGLCEGSCLLLELGDAVATAPSTSAAAPAVPTDRTKPSNGPAATPSAQVSPSLPVPARTQEPKQTQAALHEQVHLDRGFRGATLLIVFSTPKNLVHLPHLRRWYAPHFKRIMVYCTKETQTTSDAAAADDARAMLSALSAPPSLVDGVVFTYAKGAHFPFRHYMHFIDSELAPGADRSSGLFAIMADVLINTPLLRDLSPTQPILPYLISHPNDAESAGRTDASGWAWWEQPEGRPALRAVERDAAGLAAIVRPGETIRFVAGYADFFYVPASHITPLLRDSFDVFYRNEVFLELGTPSALFWSVARDFALWPWKSVGACLGHPRPCTYLVMWEDPDRVYRPNGIEQAFADANLVIHPVNLREHPEIVARIDALQSAGAPLAVTQPQQQQQQQQQQHQLPAAAAPPAERPPPAASALLSAQLVPPALSNGRACAMRELARHESLSAGDADAAHEAVFSRSDPAARRDPMAHFIPIHEPSFKHALALLATHADTAAATAAAGEEAWDIFYVFESSAQADAFRAALGSGPRPDLVGTYGAIVLAPWMHAQGNVGSAMVNTKSWAALAVLRPCYDVIMYSDSEVQLLRTKGLVQRLREKAAHTTLFATFGCPWMQQTQASAELLRRFGKLAALEQLRNISRGFTSFFHFSDVVIFDGNDLLDFFELYNYPREALADTEYVVAVHNAYGHFRAARHEWDLVDLQQVGFQNAVGNDHRTWLWSLEDTMGHLAQGDLRRLAAQFPPGVAWAHHIYCERWPAECDERSSIFYVFHVDRHP